jgi:type IV pilus assembly protein PilC
MLAVWRKKRKKSQQKKYAYRGYNSEKEAVSGIIEASAPGDAVRRLKSNGVTAVVYLKPVKEYALLKKLAVPALKLAAGIKRFKKSAGLVLQSAASLGAIKNSELLTALNKSAGSISSGDRIKIFLEEDITIGAPDGGDTGEHAIEKPAPGRDILNEKSAVSPKPRRPGITDGKKIPWERIRRRDTKNARISLREVRQFMKQLAVLLSSGVSLSRALVILKDGTRSRRFRGLIQQVLDDVSAGNSLSYALSRYPKQFNDLCLALVAVGETSGTLSTCLFDAADFLETQEKTLRSIKGAMAYPVIILVVVTVMLVAGSQFFIPMFADLFADLGAELPRFTRMVFAAAGLIKYIVPAVVLGFAGTNLLLGRIKPLGEKYIRIRDEILLKLPLTRGLVLTGSLFYFSHIMGLMLKNGVRMIDSLIMSARTVPSAVVRAGIEDAAETVLEGVELSKALSRYSFFDSMFCSMVNTGEESGRLDYVLNYMASLYSEQLKTGINNAVQMLQPVMILAVAAVVIPVVLAVFIPLLDLTSGQFMQS